ncbi:MAG: hypothetical protein Q4E74_09280 [Ruminococcus sp.]|nr:hypothetical protein [Ruminococcus sp.]
MLSREEMTKLLAEEYGIHNDKELDEALKKVSINIAIFTKPMEVQNGTRNIQEVS